MAGDIPLSFNFEVSAAKPIDARFQVADITARDAIAFKYAGLVTKVISTGLRYEWDGSAWNEVGGGTALSDATPQALGTAAAGTSGEGSRADHKHAMPTAAQVGADPAGTAAAGDAAHLAASDPHPQYPLAKFYNSSGEISAQVKIWTGTVTSDSNGDFTVNYSSAGFTSPPMVTVSALSTTTDTVRDKQWATLYGTPTTTSATGYTLRGMLIIAVLIGGAETIRDAGNVVVHVQAIGV